MSRRSLIACLFALALLAGCIPSLNPVYREEDLVTEPRVVGVWMQKGEKARWIFQNRDAKSYSLVYLDNEGRENRFIVHLARIEGELFLDMFPEPLDGKANSFYTFHHVPIHSIYRVHRIEPTLELGAIDFQWLEDELSKNPTAIESRTFNGRRLITAPTDDVRAFAVKHKDRFTARVELTQVAGQNEK
jgi:hypothetical protein